MCKEQSKELAVRRIIDGLITKKDIVDTIRDAYKLHIFYVIMNGYRRTRNYEYGLVLAEILLATLEDKRNEITNTEYRRWRPDFISFKLDMLDRLNYWSEYIEYFKKVRKTTDFFGLYCQNPDTAPDRFGSYLLGYDGKYQHVHFLYLHHRRYEIIKRKHNKMLQGKDVEHLRCNQQDRLTDKEIEHRIRTVFGLVEAEIIWQMRLDNL